MHVQLFSWWLPDGLAAPAGQAVHREEPVVACDTRRKTQREKQRVENSSADRRERVAPEAPFLLTLQGIARPSF